MRIIDIIIFKLRHTDIIKKVKTKGSMPWLENRNNLKEIELGLLISIVSVFTKKTLVYLDMKINNLDGAVFYVHYLRAYSESEYYNVETGMHATVQSKKWIDMLSSIITGRKHIIYVL